VFFYFQYWAYIGIRRRNYFLVDDIDLWVVEGLGSHSKKKIVSDWN